MFCLKTRSVFFLWGILIALSVVSSCKEKTTQTYLYNVDSLISQQVHTLTLNKAKLRKQGFIDGRTDTLVYIPDSSGCTQELGIFSKLGEINKPVNRSNSLIDDGLYDVSSNLT